MTIFISHDFDNKPEFENVTDALDQRDVPWWNPSEIVAGASLRDQLRAAVQRCSACVFVATRDSVASSWCGSELGAFWGAGRPIFIYLAEPSLKEADLPEVVKGGYMERRLSRIAEVAAAADEQAAGPSAPPAQDEAVLQPSVMQLTPEDLQKLIVSAVALARAESKNETAVPAFDAVQAAASGAAGKVLSGYTQLAVANRRPGAYDPNASWARRVLWVDDNPGNNVHEREAMQAMGLSFDLATSTTQALDLLKQGRHAAIISDMGRAEGPREGYALLEAVRAVDRETPFYIYAGSRAAEHQREAALRGAQGMTNRPDELIEMVMRGLPGTTRNPFA